ncbi:unnamed protein product [Diamesa hyperborea]
MAMRISLPRAVTTASEVFEESPISRYDSYANQPQINTDLLAPEPSSLSKFYHDQPKEYQTQGYNPFLFMRHTETDTVPKVAGLIHQKEPKNIVKSSQNPEKSEYHIFTPTNEGDVVDYDDMAVPAEEQEPNYYSAKPQKTKNEETIHEEEEPSSKSPTGTRVDFQMHGHNGPKSYKFGYDTGFGKNRQFRLEERDKEGNVFGQYGYINRKGALKIVKYTAGLEGFKVIQ